MGARIRTLAAALGTALLAAGCLFTTIADPQNDAAAKQFATHPAAASIFVYRSRFNHQAGDSVLYLDGRIVGMTQPGAYYRLDTTPGVHTLHGTGSDSGQIMVTARGGQLYFVSVDVIGGHSSFSLVAEDAGREQVRACCVLMNTAPFLRGAPVY